jgi:hypothetical protein
VLGPVLPYMASVDEAVLPGLGRWGLAENAPDRRFPQFHPFFFAPCDIFQIGFIEAGLFVVGGECSFSKVGTAKICPLNITGNELRTGKVSSEKAATSNRSACKVRERETSPRQVYAVQVAILKLKLISIEPLAKSAIAAEPSLMIKDQSQKGNRRWSALWFGIGHRRNIPYRP